MCEFLSWIDYKGRLYYLTNNLLFETRRGKELRKYEPDSEEWRGHGCIAWYYGLKYTQGRHFECEDFSLPDNFPAQIVKDIKAGNFRGIGMSRQLLTESAWKQYEEIAQPAWKQYKEITQPAWKQYKEITQPAWKQYEEITQSAWKQYEEIAQSAWKQYEEIAQSAWKQYEEIAQPAWKQYEEIAQSAFWDLFLNADNRPICWR